MKPDLQPVLFTVLDRLLIPGSLIVGFSGGVDSRVLLEILHRYVQNHPGYELQAIHVHHGLNPKADAWAEYCQNTCQAMHIPLKIERIQLQRKNRQSLEDIARQARYDVFRKAMQPETTLITAHHQDDQIETCLLALKRGSGPRGLAGMPEQMSFHIGRLIRPCLNMSKQLMLAWAEAEGLTWVDDDSNLNEDFDRNFLRQSVIPLLNSRWPQFTESASRSMQLCAEQEALAAEIAESDLSACITSHDALDLTIFAAFSLPRQNQLLRTWLRQLTGSVPTHQQLQNIHEQVISSREDAAPQLKWEKGVVSRYQNKLYFYEKSWPEIVPHHVDLNQTSCFFESGELQILRSTTDPVRIRLPVKNENVTICSGLAGSIRLQPAHRPHSRELKKLWQEYQVAPWLRKGWPVLCYDEQVVAVCGLFTCKSFLVQGEEEGVTLHWHPKA